jgi:hypothetical protein
MSAIRTFQPGLGIPTRYFLLPVTRPLSTRSTSTRMPLGFFAISLDARVPLSVYLAHHEARNSLPD